MLEQGKISSSSPRIISKVEKALGIVLKKEGAEISRNTFSEEIQEQKKPVPIEGTVLSFDPVTAKTITISDLKKIQNSERERNMEEKWKKEDDKLEKELSDEEIDDLIFGRQ
jgi:hypothetical protein